MDQFDALLQQGIPEDVILDRIIAVMRQGDFWRTEKELGASDAEIIEKIKDAIHQPRQQRQRASLKHTAESLPPNLRNMLNLDDDDSSARSSQDSNENPSASKRPTEGED